MMKAIHELKLRKTCKICILFIFNKYRYYILYIDIDIIDLFHHHD